MISPGTQSLGQVTSRSSAFPASTSWRFCARTESSRVVACYPSPGARWCPHGPRRHPCGCAPRTHHARRRKGPRLSEWAESPYPTAPRTTPFGYETTVAGRFFRAGGWSWRGKNWVLNFSISGLKFPKRLPICLMKQSSRDYSMKIDGYGSCPAGTFPGASNAPVDARPQTVGADTVATGGEGTQRPNPVAITSDAQALNDAAERINQTPAISQARVDAVRSALERGNASLTRRESQSALSSSKTHSERSRKPCSLPP